MKPFDTARDEFCRAYLTELLRESKGNIAKAARIAGRNRTSLYKMFTRHGVSYENHLHVGTWHGLSA